MTRRTTLLLACVFQLALIAMPDHARAQPTETPDTRAKRFEVYLTFDDGPVYGSDDVLDNLKTAGVVASFFVNGFNFDPKEMGKKRVLWATSVLKRMWAEGHLVGNHTYTHKYNYDNPLKVVVDFEDNEDAIRSASGSAYQAAIFTAYGRFPGSNTWRVGSIVRDVVTRGNSTKKAADSVSKKLNYRIIGWDVEWRQGKGVVPLQSPKQMATEVFTALEKKKTQKPGKVILLTHDRLFRSSKKQGQKVLLLIKQLRAMAQQKKVQLSFKRVDNY